MTEPTYEQQRIYRVIGHDAFAFTEATPIKKLDTIVRDMAQAIATPEIRGIAGNLRDTIREKSAAKRGKPIRFSEGSALELTCRIGMLLHHLEQEATE